MAVLATLHVEDSSKFRVRISDVDALSANAQHSPGKVIDGIQWCFAARESTYPHWNLPDISVICMKSMECRVWHYYATLTINVMNQKDGGVAMSEVKENCRFTRANPEVKIDFTKYYGLVNLHEVFMDESVVIEAMVTEVVAEKTLRRKFSIDLTTPSELQDCTLKMRGGKMLFVNRAFLAQHSAYFFDLFFKGVTRNQAFFEFEDVESDNFIGLIKILYGCGDEVTADNVGSLLYLAHRFNIPVILDIGEELLMGTNTIETLKKAEQFGLYTLMDQIINSIVDVEVLRDMGRSNEYAPKTRLIVKERLRVREREEAENMEKKNNKRTADDEKSI